MLRVDGENNILASDNPLGLECDEKIPCDCHHPFCNPDKCHFKERKLDRVPTESSMLEYQRSGPGKGNVLMRKTTYGIRKRQSPLSV
jgi:hypothetical protein